MVSVSISEAKNRLSRLVDRATQGEEIVITRYGKPVAKIVRSARAGKKRKLGSMKGQIRVAPDFDDPLPEELVEAFEKRG